MNQTNKRPGTVVRLVRQMKGQQLRLTVVAVSIVVYVALSIWNPMYSAIAIDHLWQSIQAAWRDGTRVDLTAKEFDLMELLMRNPGRVYSRENLLNVVWGYEYIGDYRTVDVHIRRLREKLELDPANPEYIRTKWGVGYYLSVRKEP